MDSLKLKPTKRIDDALVKLKEGSDVRGLSVLHQHHHHSIVLIVYLTEKSLELFHFNINVYKTLKYAKIPLQLGKLGYREQLLTVQHLNPAYIGVKTNQNILAVYSLKTKKLVLEIKHPAQSTGILSFFTNKPISLYSCFLGDQVITWAENSTKLCFWELSKKSKSENALTLTATPSSHYALIENRNLLILQVDNFKYLEIIDLVKRTSLKTIPWDPDMKLTAPSTEENIYFFFESDMQGTTTIQIFALSLNESLEFARVLSPYNHCGPCANFSVLAGGKYVTISDIRKAKLIDFSGESPQPYHLSRRDCFDVRGFIKIKGRKLVFAPGKDGSVWIWRL